MQKEQNEQEEQENKYQYLEYVVKEFDTIFGIALEYNLNPEGIKRINQLDSDYICQGIKLKIPIKEGQSDRDYNRIQLEKMVDFKFGNQHLEQSVEIKIQKYEFYYCTTYGEIKGTLTINPYLIMFDPDMNDQMNEEKLKGHRVIQFQACLDLEDIITSQIVTLPSKFIDSQGDNVKDYLKDYYLQFHISRSNQEVGTLFFKIYDKDSYNLQISDSTKLQKISEINQQLIHFLSIFKQNQSRSKKQSNTNVPFFDLLYDSAVVKNINIHKIHFPLNKPQPSQKITYIPKLNQFSDIFDEEVLVQIVKHIPAFLRIRNWQRVYSLINDGVNYNTLIRNSYDTGQQVLFLQDFNQNVIGAYLSDSLQIQDQESFYGNGECFLFKIHQQTKLSVFKWKKTNNYFIYCSNDGFGVGMGDKYGIFIDKELYKASTHPTTTFDSPALLEQNYFQIKNLEIWSLQDNFNYSQFYSTQTQ